MGRTSLSSLWALAVALVGAGCGPGAPSAVEDAGAEVDAGCALPGGATVGHVVRVVYLVPADMRPDDNHIRALEGAVRHVQLWFRDRTDDGRTFQVFRPVVETAVLSHPASYYPTNDSGREPRLWFWDNVTRDAFEVTGARFNDERSVWLFYIPLDPSCDQSTGAVSGVSLFPQNDLRGLTGQPPVPICAGDEPEDPGRCRWVGGMAALFGIAIGMESPPRSADYPDADITSADQAFLADNRFFSPLALPSCALDCSRR